MRTIKSILAVACMAAVAFACTAAKSDKQKDTTMVTVTRSVNSDFSKIDASTGMNVVYIQGSPRNILVEGRQCDIDLVDIYTKKGELNIERKKSESMNIFGNKKSLKVKITVTAPEVNEFEVGTGSSISIPSLKTNREIEIEVGTGGSLSGGTLEAPSTSVDISTGGSGSITSILSDDVTLDVSTGSSLTVAGSGNKISIDASTGSSVNASGFKAEEARVDASTGSTVKFYGKNAKVDKSTGSTVKNSADR